MNRGQIKEARRAAERFAALCIAADDELRAMDSNTYIGGTKTSGALRRASLDLTRALAEMRKS